MTYPYTPYTWVDGVTVGNAVRFNALEQGLALVLGVNALQSLTSGTDNFAMGTSALQLTTTGVNNSAVGIAALQNNVSGGYNTGVGSGALQNATGSINTGVGYLAQTGAGIYYATAIGGNTTANAHGSVAIGIDSTGAGASTTVQDEIVLGTALHGLCLGTSAPALSATTGFPYMPATAGTPTGVPVAKTGRVAFRYDTTAHKLWIYDGAWLGVVVS